MNKISGYEFIHKYLKKCTSPSDIVLEVACGVGQYASSVNGRYIGFDITAEDYSPGNPRKVNFLASARFIPCKAESFTFIFTVASLSLFSGPVLCLKEFYRVLKKKGRVVIFDYTRRTLERFVEPYYQQNILSHSIWSGPQLARLLCKAGFKEVKWDIPEPKSLYKKIIFSLIKPLYKPFHDYFEGWLIVTGIKR
jgi:ubiquinone/menaquinone biosynthesis C-methylase UbiE